MSDLTSIFSIEQNAVYTFRLITCHIQTETTQNSTWDVHGIQYLRQLIWESGIS